MKMISHCLIASLLLLVSACGRNGGESSPAVYTISCPDGTKPVTTSASDFTVCSEVNVVEMYLTTSTAGDILPFKEGVVVSPDDLWLGVIKVRFSGMLAESSLMPSGIRVTTLDGQEVFEVNVSTDGSDLTWFLFSLSKKLGYLREYVFSAKITDSLGREVVVRVNFSTAAIDSTCSASQRPSSDGQSCVDIPVNNPPPAVNLCTTDPGTYSMCNGVCSAYPYNMCPISVPPAPPKVVQCTPAGWACV